MKNLNNKVAAITGAASGIGRALALNLTDEGCHLAISDINEAGLQETADMVRSRRKNVRVTTHKVDTADREQVRRYAEEVMKAHGAVHIIINNAGVVIAETLEDLSYEDFEWLMGINLWGVVYGSKEFLPYLKQQDCAHIVNISSVNGIFTNPNNGPYCTAKFAVRGFTETLAQELADTNIKVSCVHPGGIKTNIAANARFYKASDESINKEDAAVLFTRAIAGTTADKAAKIIIAGIKKDKLRIMVGPDAYVMDWLKRLFPVGFQKLAGRKTAPRWMKKRAGIQS
ncbi:MAG: SDR family NAD(P)-dependent oxidoreductase [Deltaproteobacteria bacterium]|nr:SDR family NAD(P)-dependent oxidoreductase [Deltaproteobacteria bacterium]